MRKRRWLAGLLSLALVITMLPGTVLGATSELPFLDVVGSEYETAVRALYDVGVVGGTTPTTYSPSNKVTRAQMAALLVRALTLKGEAAQGAVAKFSDVPTTHWAFGEVMTAERYSIVKGMTDTTFAPEDPVTYPQAAVMALRALGYDNGQLTYPTGYVLKAQELGLIQGLRWDLSAEMTRGEVAVLLANTVFRVKHFLFDKTLSQQYFRKAVSLEIAPAGEVLVAGQTQLSAMGKDAYGMPLTGFPASWRVTAGTATISDGGLLTATNGEVSVEASVGDVRLVRTYKVLSGISVSPAISSAKPGDKLQLSVADADNSGISVPSATWTVTAGSATVDATGLVSVAGTGNITVQAAIGGLRATATINSVTGLRIEPANPIVAVGGNVTFTVKKPDGTPFSGPVQWSVEGSGIISQDGKFTAAAGSTPVVKVKAGSLEGSTGVTVLNRLTITPGSAVTVVKTKTQQFTAKGITTTGQEVDLPITWNVTGRVGIIGEAGTFVATNPGTGTVVASYGGLQQVVSVSVSGDPYQVALTASRTTVPANGRSPITLTATLKDANGYTVNMDTPISFLMSDASKGTLSATTIKTVAGVATVTFTPSTQTGAVRVTAAAADLSILAGYADITSFAPVPSKIVLSAYPNPLASAANSRASVTATLVDSEGYEIRNGTGTTQIVTLSFTNTTAASLSSTQIYISPNQSKGEVSFFAGNPGDTTLHASANYPVQSLTVKTLVAGPAAGLAIRSDIADTKADGSAEMTVQVEVRDAVGVVRTQDHGLAITLTGVSEDGQTVIPAQSQITQNGVATFRIRSLKAGKFTFTATASTLASATGVGNFTPGPVTGLKLSVQPTDNLAADGTSTVRLRAELVDANSNVVPDGTGTVTFTKTINNNATTLPATATVPAVKGVAEIVLTSSVYPGTDTFKASAAGLADSNTKQVTTRITGVPSKLIAEVTSGSVVVGSRVTVKVYVHDSLNQTVTSQNNRTVRLVPNSPTAQVTGTGVTESGVATFTVTDTKAGIVALTATSDGLASDATKSVQFTAGTPARIALKLSSDEMSADAGQSYVQLTADVEDAYGNRVNQAVPLTLTTNRNDVVTLSSPSLYTGNFVMVRATNVPGSVTISGTGSIPVQPVTLSTFVPAAPAKVRVESIAGAKVGQQQTFRVRLLDSNGHVLTSQHTGSFLSAVGVIVGGSANNSTVISNTNLYGLTNFSGNGVSHGSAALSSGVATFTFTNTKAETVTVTPVAYYNGVPLAVESGTITTVPGNAVKLAVTASRTGLSTSTPESAVIEAVLSDAFDNVVTTDSADTFNFAFSNSAYVGTDDQVSIPTTSGRASIQISSKVHSGGGQTLITVTSAKTGYSGQVTITTDNPPATPILFATDNSGMDAVVHPGDSGVRLVITADSRNSNQTVVAFVNGIQVNLYATPTGGSSANTIAPGQTTLVAYITRSDLGGAGNKAIRVVVQNAVASSPMSNTQTVTVQ